MYLPFSCWTILLHLVCLHWCWQCFSFLSLLLDSEFDEMDGPHINFRPEALETLCQLTKFTKRELQMMYRGFKQVSDNCITQYSGGNSIEVINKVMSITTITNLLCLDRRRRVGWFAKIPSNISTLNSFQKVLTQTSTPTMYSIRLTPITPESSHSL